MSVSKRKEEKDDRDRREAIRLYLRMNKIKIIHLIARQLEDHPHPGDRPRFHSLQV